MIYSVYGCNIYYDLYSLVRYLIDILVALDSILQKDPLWFLLVSFRTKIFKCLIPPLGFSLPLMQSSKNYPSISPFLIPSMVPLLNVHHLGGLLMGSATVVLIMENSYHSEKA